MSITAGPEDIGYQLARHTRQVMQDNWAVLAPVSDTQFTVRLANPAAVVPNVLSDDAANYVGARIEFVAGILGGITPTAQQLPQMSSPVTAYGRVSVTIKSVATTTGPLTTTVTLNSALPAQPAAGDRFIVYRSGGTQDISGTVTANQGTAGAAAWPVTSAQGAAGASAWPVTAGQGAAGTSPWLITNNPTAVTTETSPGTAVAANAKLFSTSYSPASSGTIICTVAIAPAGTQAVLQVTRDNASAWYSCLSGMELQPGYEYALAFQVHDGDEWNVSFSAGTTLGYVYADFVASL